jgi:hypothetical protein
VLPTADQLQTIELELLAEYWSLLQSGLPFEWIEDERRAFVDKLRVHRELLGRVLAAGDELDTMRPGWLEMQAGYESLSTWLDTIARPGPAARAQGGGA